MDRTAIEHAVAELELVEIPAARGCTYYVPRDDAALGLRLAGLGSSLAEFRMAERHLGVTDDEVRGLADEIARAIEDEGSLDPRTITARVSPRSLGEEGKKRGMTSTLSLGLSRLQLDGRIRRLPHEGRLDTERFRYAAWPDGPRPDALDLEEAAQAMADRYFGWAGPATEREFREFTGLPARLSKMVTQGLVPCPDDPLRLMRPEDVESYARFQGDERPAMLLASLDPWLHLRRNLPTLLDPADANRTVPYGASLKDVTSLRDLDSHPIVEGGVVVGMWEYDPEAKAVAAWTWRPSASTAAAIEQTGEWIARELGDFRSFSLDSPASRRPRVERLRSLA